jgi:reactive intermediate/imine deaminase
MPGTRTLPFSEAVRVGDMLYLSGQLGTDSAGRLVPGGIGPETRQALSNIADALTRHGSSLDRVVKCTVMLADITEWAAMNEVYLAFFGSHRPARSAFGTSGLALGARLELECIAALVAPPP